MYVCMFVCMYVCIYIYKEDDSAEVKALGNKDCKCIGLNNVSGCTIDDYHITLLVIHNIIMYY